MDKDKIDEMCKEYRTIFKARKKELEKYTFVTHETAMNGFEFFTAIFEQIMDRNSKNLNILRMIRRAIQYYYK